MDVRTVADLSPAERRAFFERDAGVEGVREDVREIVERVREEGDVAVREFAEEFDGVAVGNIDVTDDAARAHDELADADDPVLDAVREAAANVREFHERQRPEDWRDDFGGRELGRRFRPIDRVGVYVPGGAAAYPSSALMGIIPAVVAGVDHVAVATPPAADLNPVTLAAIHEAGADAVYQVGGAQAVAALAYGTETVTRVQKIVGPGNKWVTAAKSIVQGDAEIDFLAGPSEVLVLADETADPALVAADLVAQAEHDPNASVVAVTDDADLAAAVADAVEAQAAEREREETIRAALDNEASGVLHARSMPEAVLFAEEYAAEHLSIVADDDEALLDRITNAGSVFLGPHSPVAAGDYAAGTNHVLPTNGGAKRYGGLSVDTFLRSSTVQRLDRDALDDLSETITSLAEAEGLEAHAESVRKRFE
ncbi:histidinol dehydrogenase [Halorubrum ezzemoulense]|uniref:Histidinol dehydrogenase n=1 Tax=Halorubrum ezzemoulense TaxID=337243 RepID=A0A256JN28_HALEZ|nr:MULTISPECIES: histidinol dehydrogenase [Halorubrum]MDB2238342.1 histidinol dehydrogenase [Halorubrum ezzemoulense]MDB2247811.1 histidinol dehydrogenase [Halorubrum ezzemoulense]MDB2260507.1 histidinol dehydrogenase [Halorubrum ezzemoulense]MDB2267100.1 histidinol dehydrogenase [Halorubrum ezzemoulense]MDB9248840.1 histidinol dehydrogenase [Halorubrum ezzemoulense]